MKTKNLKINDLNLELQALSWNSEWSQDESEILVKDKSVFVVGLRLDDEGNEMGTKDILTPELLNVTVIGEWREKEDKELGDWLCDAALMLEPDTEYIRGSFEDIWYDAKPLSESELFGEVFITEEQKQTNFNFAMAQLAKANNFKRLKVVRESVLTGQKKENGMYFFPKGKSKVFWAAYNAKKAEVGETVKRNNAILKKYA